MTQTPSPATMTLAASPPEPLLRPYDRYRATRQFGSLDGLRCAAILAVIWHHTVPEGHGPFPAEGRGFLGVDLFFVLSGFLIVTLLLRERDSTGSISLKKFYARRTLRIFPLYYGLLAGLTLVMLVAKPGTETSRQFFAALPSYLTYTSNWTTVHAVNLGITWSLAAEEQFYLIWPAVEKILRRGWLWFALAGVLVLNQAVNFRLMDAWLEKTLGLRYDDLSMLQVTFTPILLGVTMAHVLHHRRAFDAVNSVLGRWGSSLVLFLGLIVLCNLPGDLGGWPRLLIQLTMMALLAACVVREDHALRRVLTFPWVVRIGVISYGMYLFHLWARQVAVIVIGRSSAAFPGDLFLLTLLLTVLVSEASFRFYEQPFLKLKKRFSRSGRPVAAEVAV